MKNISLCILAIVVVALGFFAFTNARQDGVKDLVAFVDNAANLVSEKGTAAFVDFNDPQGDWILGDRYVFVYDMVGNTLVLPPQDDLVGTNRMTTADPQGEKFVATMAILLAIKDYGWNSYLYVKPGETTPSYKLSYFKKVENGGMSYIVGSGIYVAK